MIRLLPYLVLAIVLLSPDRARAQALVADLTSHLIAITTGFTGTEVVLFGAIDGDGDGEVVVVVRGPEQPVVVRRKERVLGMWLNRRQVTFASVPGFYALATSRPLADILRPEVLQRQRIGTEQLGLAPARALGEAELEAFRTALVRNKQGEGLFPTQPGQVSFLGGRLFRTTVNFPSNVPTGTYQVQVFLVRDGQVAGAQTTPLLISKLGVSAEIVDFAYRRSIVYGLVAVLIAVVAGWAASAMFRRG